MVGGGPGAFIGDVHRKAAALDGEIDLVAGAFSSSPEKSRQKGEELHLDSDRVYGSYEEMAKAEAALPEDERELTVVQQQLSEVGIELSLDIQQASSYWDNTYRYEQSLVAYGGAADVDPWMSDFKQLGMPDQETGEGAWQRPLYFNEEFSELLHEANASPDLEERASVYEDVVAKFVEDAPFVMTTFPLNPKGFGPGVSGIGVQAGLSNFHSASLEE